MDHRGRRRRGGVLVGLVVLAGSLVLLHLTTVVSEWLGVRSLTGLSVIDVPVMIVLAVLAARVFSRSPRRVLALARVPVITAATVTLTAVPVVIVIDALLGVLAGPVPASAGLHGVDPSHASAAFAVLLSILVIAAGPVAEELWYRGWLYHNLRQQMNPTTATILVAVVFCASHYLGPGVRSPRLAGEYLIMGAALCIVVERTRSLYPAIALHAINNALSLTAAGGGTSLQAASLTTATIVTLACLIFCRRRPRISPSAMTTTRSASSA
jgi:membrane protease YdiL (CAAX protease family)